ncbi:hypothetical protein BS47DRAFT_1367414 [Hydnum rufescens UP504]|uniref:Uncharacterized protein n=1 Tax=Hydnum rufescens UP504 TaxID=1448309 RepID=A0A9P6AIG4_9AGAM|nr:hypothetical protein BS47DRAFT_1367414 [Hydnum rufescens UP504]
MTQVIPIVHNKLDYHLNRQQIGQPKQLAPWQANLKKIWADYSKSDKAHHTKKEQLIIGNIRKSKACTDKHGLQFFYNLHQHHTTPFYYIPGIHGDAPMVSPSEAVADAGLDSENDVDMDTPPSPQPSHSGSSTCSLGDKRNGQVHESPFADIDGLNQVCFKASYIQSLKRNFNEIYAEITDGVFKLGDAIGKEKHRKTMKKTWGDLPCETFYM